MAPIRETPSIGYVFGAAANPIRINTLGSQRTAENPTGPNYAAFDTIKHPAVADWFGAGKYLGDKVDGAGIDLLG